MLRVTALALLLVFGLTASAVAECAWVLWEHRDNVRNDLDPRFRRLGSFTARRECMKASRARADAVATAERKAYEAAYRREGLSESYLEGVLSASVTMKANESGWEVYLALAPPRKPGDATYLAYECWPDTVDLAPRERWVLWTQLGEMIDDPKTTPYQEMRVRTRPANWVVEGVHSTKGACESAHTAALNDRSRLGRLDDRHDWVYECLPDTVDPRGPKGK